MLISLYILIGVLIVVSAITGSFKVEEGHRAIVLRWGKPVRTVLEPGIHGKMPWDKVRVFSIMEKVVDLGDQGHPIQVFLKDGTSIALYASIRLRMIEKEWQQFLFEVKDIVPHMKELFECILRNEVAQFSDFSEFRKNRDKMNPRIRKFLSENMQSKYGIEFLSVDIRELIPPVELMDSLNSYQKATAGVETEYSRVYADCETRIEAANHGVEIARKKAEAVEIDIKTLVQALVTLQGKGVLKSYVSRRHDEIRSAAKTVYSKL